MTPRPGSCRPDRSAARWRDLLLPLLVLLLSPAATLAQLPAGTSDSSSSSQPQATVAEDPQRTEAAQALDRHDFPLALKLLIPLAARYPADAHVLFDLGSAQDALSDTDPTQTAAAETTYRRAIAADPAYLEPHLALGLLLARSHRDAEARSELRSASTLNTPEPALRARALRALAQLDRTADPAAARDSLLAALKLTPETPDDALFSADLAADAQDLPAAEATYRRLLKRAPNDPAATVALARLLTTENKSAEVEPLLTTALAAHPDDPALNAQLAVLELHEGRTAEATALIEKLHATSPDNPGVTHLYARLLSQSGQYEQSEPLFRALSLQSPSDPALLDDHADALIHLKRYPEAQQLLERAIAKPAAFPSKDDLGAAASHLAFAATQNNDPTTVLRALSLRATLLPQSPSSLFLSAAANDKLHRTKQAAELYRQFLSVANGKFPDEEWEARHRLLTLDHMK